MSRAVVRRGMPPVAAGVGATADRRFRRPDVRPGRRRRVSQVVWRAGRVALLALAVVAAGGWTVRAVLGSRLFTVESVVVTGNSRLTGTEVDALLDGLRGRNILQVDLDAYRRSLMDSPWVAGATLWRVLPGTIKIQIVERTPMAIARLGRQLYLVDDTGVIIDEFGPDYRMFDLPIVDGLIPSPARGDAAVDAARVRLTGRFLDALASRSDLRVHVSQIDVSDAHDVVVLEDDDPALLHLGEDHFVERLVEYRQLAAALHDRFTTIDSVDLRFADHVFVNGRPEPIGTAKD
jgi:cell division septal protein FtsQ